MITIAIIWFLLGIIIGCFVTWRLILLVIAAAVVSTVDEVMKTSNKKEL